MRVSDTYSTYVIKGMTLYENTTVTLKAGKSYIIDGDLYINSGSAFIDGVEATTLYINGSLTIENASMLSGLTSLDVYVKKDITLKGDAQAQGSYYSAGNATLQTNAILTGRVSAQKVEMQSSSKVIYDDGQPKLECFNDNFNSSQLKPEWVVKTSKGTFSPSIKNSRLRLTENKNDQATSLTYLKLFPAANNLVTVEFDHSAYGGTGADGIAMVLSDAKITPQPGHLVDRWGMAIKAVLHPDLQVLGWVSVLMNLATFLLKAVVIISLAARIQLLFEALDLALRDISICMVHRP